MHEIVTIQLGTQSNYVATHFWNAQESYFTYPPDPPSEVDHNVHFRPGITRNGTETFTPRALVYDFKEHFGALGPSGGLYDEEVDQDKRDGGIWSSGTLTTIRQPQIPPSTYHTSLATGAPLPKPLTTSSIRSFTDYLTPFYHSRSLHPVSILSLPQSTLPAPVPTSTTSSTPHRPTPSSAFQTWQTGTELFQTLNASQDLLEDSFRSWVEECDALQGISLLFDADTAWGGFAKGFLDGARDDLGPKASIWLWAVNSTSPSSDQSAPSEIRDKQRRTHLLNNAYSIFELESQASVYIPLATEPKTKPAYLDFERGSAWHESAVQVLGYETGALTSRLREMTEGGKRGLLRDLETVVKAGTERRVVGLGVSVENAAAQNGNGHADGQHQNGNAQRGYDDDDQDMEKLDMDLYPDFGISSAPNDAKRSHVFGRVDVKRGMNDPAADDDAGEEDVQRRFQGPVVESYTTSQAFPVLETYPRIFAGVSSKKNLTVRTTLDTNSKIADSIRQMEQSVRRLVTLDERESLCNGLKTIAEEYVEGWESGSDDGDDEDW